MDERPTSFPADVMPSTTTTATTASTGSTLHAIPYEDTTIRSDSLSTPGASSVDSDSRSRSISTTGSSFAGGATGPGGAGDQPRASPTSSHGNKFPETGLAAKDNRKIRSEGDSSGLSLRSIPSIIVNDAASLRPSSRPDSRPSSRPDSRPGSRPSSRWSERKWGGLRTRRSAELDRPMYSVSPPSPPPPVPQMDPQFSGISLNIPTASLDGLGPQAMQFSKRGSLIKNPSQQKSGEAQLQPEPQPQPQLQQQEQQQDEGQLERKEPEQIDDSQEQQKSAEQPREPELLELQEQQDKQPEATPISPASSADDQSDVQQPQFHGAQPRLPKPSASLRVRRQISIPSRAISADEDMLSRRVRLMYEKGEENVSDSEVADSMAMENGVLWEEAAETSASDAPSGAGTRRMSTVNPDRKSMLKKETNELAGGIEYWQNIGAGDVDRYGFIRHPQTSSGETTEQPNPIQRVATSLLLSSETPRRKHSIRPPSALASNRSFTGRSPTRKFSEPSIRPSSSQSTYSSPMRRSTSRFRHAANHLPHNRDRRFTDEAADMLTLPVEAVGSANGIDSAAARAMRKKEWEREDKWAKMARPSKKNKDGGGMKFEFDTQNSKLIERTWKGIPDRWRSTAWYSFLEASARKRSNSPSETELMEAYHEFQYVSSPDDVQIDIDVPRTITSHIMFRRRYRGGQRLLFRVLHAMSLYFPDTGYVQGMAALAATLLAYYDEEHTFIMLVRLWQLRGLERLYEHGFSGLMEALGDFEREWLGGGEVANKLNEVGIPPTAYGTRWYLTLFNYSIPFPAQLRVWDVFMLLGDADPTPSHSVLPLKGSKQPQTGTFGKGLDVLHATSAALIDGMRDIILESDFENSMKVLTSWVPIKDIELFMRVAKAEWKVHHRKKFS